MNQFISVTLLVIGSSLSFASPGLAEVMDRYGSDIVVMHFFGFVFNVFVLTWPQLLMELYLEALQNKVNSVFVVIFG